MRRHFSTLSIAVSLLAATASHAEEKCVGGAFIVRVGSVLHFAKSASIASSTSRLSTRLPVSTSQRSRDRSISTQNSFVRASTISTTPFWM
jgi:hypothetical protein